MQRKMLTKEHEDTEEISSYGTEYNIIKFVDEATQVH